MKKIDETKAYIYSPFGIGDLIISYGLRKYIERAYNVTLVYIVKPSHEPIAEMMSMTQYIVGTLTEEEIEYSSKKIHCPVSGEIFILHPAFHNNGEINRDFLNFEIGFRSSFCKLLGLDESETFLDITVTCNDGILNESRQQLINSKIVIILPEMNSASEYENLSTVFFEKIVEKYVQLGWHPLVNLTKDKQSILSKYKYDFSIEEIVVLAKKGCKIIAMRSGLTDLLYTIAVDMTVIFPNVAFWKLFNFSEIFPTKINPNIKEVIVDYEELLRRRGYNSCAIFGKGYVGKRIYYSLKEKNFKIDFWIDNNVVENNSESPVFKVSDVLPKTDVIIISVSFDVEIIKCRLKQYYSCDVLDLHELTNDFNI